MENLTQFFNSEFKKLLTFGFVKMTSDYQNRNAELYDTEYSNFQKDIPFYLQLIGNGPFNILELGSGTGRISIPLAEAGHTVYTLDSSDDMHKILMDKIPPGLKNKIIPVKASMCDFNMDIGASFDYIILGWNTIADLLEEKERVDCLRLVHKHLKQKGHFLIDLALLSPEDLVNTEGKYSFSVLEKPDGKKYLLLIFRKYDTKRKILILNKLSIDIDQSEKTEFFVTPDISYYLSPEEIKLLLRANGFVIDSIWCDYKKTPFADAIKRDLIIIGARKADKY